MKSIKRKQPFLDLPIIFLLITAAAFVPTPAKSIPTDSLDYILYFLRSRGHSLFANAISTSDLLFDVLSLPSLTLLPPSDPALFALDMTESPAFYLAVLRLHVLPFRLDLRYLQNNASLHTLVPSRRLHATRADRPPAASSLHLDGVEVIFPALFYSSIVAIYGLQGMLPSRVVSVPASLPPFQWFRPPPVSPRHRNRNRNRNATVIPPLVPTTRPVPFTRPIFPRRVPRSRGTNSPLPDSRTVVLSPLTAPVNLTASPESAPGDSVLDLHPFGHNQTIHPPPASANQTSLPPADQGAPALPPLASPVNTAVSSARDNRGGGGLAFPPIDGSSPTPQMSLPPAIGGNFLPPELEVDNHTARGGDLAFPPIDESSPTAQMSLPPAIGGNSLPPELEVDNHTARGAGLAFPPTDVSSPTAQMSLPPVISDNSLPPEPEVDNHTALGIAPTSPPSSDGASIALAPRPVTLTDTLPPAICPPVNLTEVAVTVPASQSPPESAARASPSPGVEDGGWPGRNVGEATTSGDDYPAAKRDDEDWEVSAGELAEVALGPAWDHVSTRDDYAMLGPNGVDYGTD
ncbi:unnamed protein product [Linum trigynum]|uniref:FAS1 domain-containing protein n=1 Tax=Linum trigynum TaxID=586398 RepID=A0AAV2CA07_9ROSI